MADDTAKLTFGGKTYHLPVQVGTARIRRLSFIHAVRVLRETAPLMRAAPTMRLPTLYRAMIQHIAQGRLPPRENRINPRVVKKKTSKFVRKRPEHYHLKQPQTSFEQSVVILK